MAAPQAPIIIKKKGGHGSHHGGAWKVAYADFVTAMMALFIVLWMMSASDQVKKAVGGYFKDPRGSSKLAGTNLAGSGQSLSLSKQSMTQLKAAIENAVHGMANFDKIKSEIEITITPEGLRIEMLEAKDNTFFNSGSDKLNADGKTLLVTLAQQLGQLPYKISIEGHTDSKPFSGRTDYTNWELSADRANAARRLMQQSGVRADQVTQVRGFADQAPRLPTNPADPSNRRVSLIVHYLPTITDGDSPPSGLGAVKGAQTENGVH
jgi:chemotaxis protein MotB